MCTRHEVKAQDDFATRHDQPLKRESVFCTSSGPVFVHGELGVDLSGPLAECIFKFSGLLAHIRALRVKTASLADS